MAKASNFGTQNPPNCATHSSSACNPQDLTSKVAFAALAHFLGHGGADMAVGSSEKIARQVDNVGFIPMQQKGYGLVLERQHLDTPEVATNDLQSAQFQNEFMMIGRYDVRDIGTET